MRSERMTRTCLLLALLLGLIGEVRAQLLPSYGRDRAGTSGFQFLKIPVDARSAALGETVVAQAFDASALFWNPALAAQVENVQVGVGHTAYFVDIRLDYLSLIYPLGWAGLTLGLSLETLDSGEMPVTTEFEPYGTGEMFSFRDLALGLSVAQPLTDLFSYGITARYVRESVAELVTQTLLFDLGIFYRVGDTGVQMAVAIRHFGFDGRPEGKLVRTVIEKVGPAQRAADPEPIATTPDPGVRIETEFETITPPTTFLLGVSYTLLRDNPQHRLTLLGQLTNPNDNAETFNVGAEYTWNHTLMVRMGYRFGVEEFRTPALGVGLRLPELVAGVQARFDYGFQHLERLGTVHRVGLNLEL
nr:PorV/PorQ family protein [Rhodothermus marinus]